MLKMKEPAFSLPPLLDDCIQGRLDFIIMRPTLLPPLLKHQGLNFKFSWWGSDYFQVLRLDPKAEELKAVYNIRCNFQGLQLYFQDAKELSVDIYVCDSTSDKNSVNSNEAEESASHFKYTRHQLRKKKEWASGDNVGTFTIPNLKLNARGEYVCDCNILNAYGDQCGSVVVFILHTTKERHKTVVLPKEKTATNVSAVEKKSPEILKQKERSSMKLNYFSPENKKTKPLVSRDELSPRFIPLQDKKISPAKIKPIVRKPKEPPKIKQSPKKTIPLDVRSPETHITRYESPRVNVSQCSGVVAAESQNLLQSSFILTKLFSFVDSGAINPTDLPTLIQICQGRSPSIELDPASLHEDFALPFLKDLSVHHSRNTCEAFSESKGLSGGYSMLKKGKRTVSFSGISYHSDSAPVEPPPEVTRIFDDDFLTSLSAKKPINEEGLESGNPTPSQSLSTDALQESLEEETTSLQPKLKETSLLVLKFDSIQFSNQSVEEEFESVPNAKPVKKRVVRQRSKLCYFVEVSFDFEVEGEDPQSAVYISRHFENQAVVFGTSRIFRLPEIMNQNRQGFLKFRVSRRRLGNRLRELVGVGIVSLDQLTVDDDCEVFVTLPLWIPTTDSKTHIKTQSINEVLEIPLGCLKFSVAFALTSLAKENLRSDFDLASNEIIGAENYENYPLVNSKIKEEEKRIPSCDISGYDFISKDRPSPELSPSDPLEIKNVFQKERTVDTCETLSKEVHLEIMEANGLPLLKPKECGNSFAPNSYVQITLPSDSLSTRIVHGSSTPKWNYAIDVELHRKDLEHTNSNLILKVFHSLSGKKAEETDDLLLGFAAIDTQFLWNSFVSICGWIPVFDLSGNTFGEIKVSLTPKHPSRVQCESFLKDITNIAFPQNGKGQIQKSLPPRETSPHSFPSTYLERQMGEQQLQIGSKNQTTQAKSVLPCVHQDEQCKFSPNKKSLPTRETSPHSFPSTYLERQMGEQQLQIGSKNQTTQAKSVLPWVHQDEQYKFSPNKRLSDQSDTVQIKPFEPTDSLYFAESTENSISPLQFTQDDAPVRDDTDGKTFKPEAILPKSPSGRCKQTNPSSNLAFVGLQWMNQLGSFDTPCVSYLDMCNIETTCSQNSTKNRPKVRRKKSRIAANLNFS